jgi:hypothetical protein
MDVLDRWEYWVALVRLDHVELPYGGRPLLAGTLNDLGAEGWELVSTSVRHEPSPGQLVCVFKRRAL